MARIPAAELEQLKRDIAVERLVEEAGIGLKRAGKDWLGRCPFHADAEASLVVTPGKNLWHCFGCGAGGGPIDWVMKRNGVSFRHAVELLKADPALAAGVAGGHAPQRTTVRALPAPVTLDADEQTLLDQVIDYYHATLKQSPEALDYLRSRGIHQPEAIARFKLGYANRTLGLRLPAKSRVEGNELRSRLQRIGIYRDSGHEHFNGSLVVPVLDAQGRAREVYGRKLRDDLRPGTPKHLYLPGPHRGVWNLDAVQASEEVIVCEALIDALTFWCAGYRNVTTAYGVEGVTAELLAALTAANIKRVLIAFDHDEAGERAAAKLAPQLLEKGVDAYRLTFPKGMDANAYALKVQPAAKSLGLLIRKAQWLGQGQAPRREPCAPMALAVAAAGEPIAAGSEPPLALAAQEAVAIAPPAAPLPAAVMPAPPRADAPAEVSEREAVLHFGEGQEARRWRVRGLPKNLAVGVLKVNLMVSDDAGSFHVDTLDLYAARARAVFLQQAAAELGLAEGMLKSDLGRVLLKLEALQDEAIREALAPKAATPALMSEAERAAALALLQAPDLLARILADFEACGIVGERTNKLTAYLAATSRLLDAPLAIVVQSASAAGKSLLMDAVLACMPPEQCVRYSALTGQSLYYLGQSNLKHKVLAISEEEGAHRASYALKLLQSEGELTIASTGTDPHSGNLITQEYRVEGPVSLFMTTTAIDVDEELMNRCLVLSVDEGRAQTQAIHVRQRERRTLAGLLERERRQELLAVHCNAQRLLRPLAVVNPYANALTFLDDRTRTRRDHEKYLALIDTIALLHQQQRPLRCATTQGRSIEYIEATLDDIAQANALAHEVLGRSLDELPPQTRKLLAELTHWVGARAKALGLPRSEVRFSRRELREALTWGDTQLKVHLARLVELELVSPQRLPGGATAYELLYDGDGSPTPHLSGLIDVQALHLYDAGRSGLNPARSAGGRAAVGAGTAPGRNAAADTSPGVARLGEASPSESAVPSEGSRLAERRSYVPRAVA
jgi:DNA primase catalytic core